MRVAYVQRRAVPRLPSARPAPRPAQPAIRGLVGQVVTELQLPLLASPKRVHREQLNLNRGPTWVALWAEWCGTCRDELPLLVQLAKKTPGGRVILVAVDELEQERARSERFAREKGALDEPAVLALWDQRQQLVNRFRADSLPASVLLDHRGRVVAAWEGFKAEEFQRHAQAYRDLVEVAEASRDRSLADRVQEDVAAERAVSPAPPKAPAAEPAPTPPGAASATAMAPAPPPGGCACGPCLQRHSTKVGCLHCQCPKPQPAATSPDATLAERVRRVGAEVLELKAEQLTTEARLLAIQREQADLQERQRLLEGLFRALPGAVKPPAPASTPPPAEGKGP